MGAHTLGKADILNSGFHGTWVNNEQVTKSVFGKFYLIVIYRDISITNIIQIWSMTV